MFMCAERTIQLCLFPEQKPVLRVIRIIIRNIMWQTVANISGSDAATTRHTKVANFFSPKINCRTKQIRTIGLSTAVMCVCMFAFVCGFYVQHACACMLSRFGQPFAQSHIHTQTGHVTQSYADLCPTCADCSFSLV